MGLSQLFEISLVNVSWSNLDLARPWRCIVPFLLLPESRRRVGSARPLVGGGVGNEVLIPQYYVLWREALARILAGRRGGRGGLPRGQDPENNCAWELSPSLERTKGIFRCPAPPCGECLFFMLERPALEQKLKTHRLRGEDPVCFEMLTVAFCPCQPEPHLRQGLLFHIFLDKISWLTARALPCRCPSAQSTCRVPGRGAELTGEETGSPNWNGAGALQDVDW